MPIKRSGQAEILDEEIKEEHFDRTEIIHNRDDTTVTFGAPQDYSAEDQ